MISSCIVVFQAAAAHMKIRIDVVIYDFRTSSYNIGSGRAGIPTVLEVTITCRVLSLQSTLAFSVCVVSDFLQI